MVPTVQKNSNEFLCYCYCCSSCSVPWFKYGLYIILCMLCTFRVIACGQLQLLYCWLIWLTLPWDYLCNLHCGLIGITLILSVRLWQKFRLEFNSYLEKHSWKVNLPGCISQLRRGRIRKSPGQELLQEFQLLARSTYWPGVFLILPLHSQLREPFGAGWLCFMSGSFCHFKFHQISCHIFEYVLKNMLYKLDTILMKH